MALAGLGLLAALSLARSALPLAAASPLAALALGHGLWLARREWRRPPCTLEFDAGGLVLIQDGRPPSPVPEPRLALRGALAALSWRAPDGRRRSLLWCADTMAAPQRRQLRLRLAAAPGDAP